MEEDIKILEEFKKNGYYILMMKYGDRNKTNLKLERALENLIKGYKEKEESEKYLYDAYQDACKKMFEYAEENEKKDRQLKIKNEYLQLIHDIAIDYDGCNTVKSLQELIDGLMEYVVLAIKNDDKAEVYFGGEKAFNILHEEIKEEV